MTYQGDKYRGLMRSSFQTPRYTVTDSRGVTIIERLVHVERESEEIRLAAIRLAVRRGGKVFYRDMDGYLCCIFTG